MENLEISNKMIADHIKQCEKELAHIKKESMLSAQRSRAKRLQEELESVKGELGIFEIDLINGNDKERDVYYGYFSEFENKVKLMEKDIQSIQNPQTIGHDTEQNDLIDPETQARNKPKQIHEMERNELVRHVDDKIAEADADLDDIINNLVQGRNIMEEINVEVKRQQEKMMKVQEDIKETYSLTKRSKKLVNYFRRNIMTDKIIWAFLIMVIIAIIVIIILQAMGFKKDKFSQNSTSSKTTST